MYYVYRFLDKSKNIIYVGKSKQELEKRFHTHFHLPNKCYEMVYRIEFISCLTESDMSIKEIYYINKYKCDEHCFFNVLDMTELPKSVIFDDKWKIYRGKLPAHFSNSLNYKKGYSTPKEIKYNKDGSIDRRLGGNNKGESTYVEAFDSKEIDLLIDYFIEEINNAENDNQLAIRFRNLIMFVLGINLPIRPGEFLTLKYYDLFDDSDNVKNYKLRIGPQQQGDYISIPIRDNVKKLLLMYIKIYNLSYVNNADEMLFQSRKHQILSVASWGRIINIASKAVNIKKNVGAESLRKTYGLTVYKKSKNKIKALLFLGELWGQEREAKVIKFLDLSDNEIDFDYFFGETFAVANVDITKIVCLQKDNDMKNKDDWKKFLLNDKMFFYMVKDIENSKGDGMATATMVVCENINKQYDFFCIYDKDIKVQYSMPNDAKEWYKKHLKNKE